VASCLPQSQLDVGTGGGLCETSGPGDDVQCPVQLAVPVAVEPMPARVARGRRDGTRAGEGGECRFRTDPIMVRMRREDDRRGHWAYALNVQNARGHAVDVLGQGPLVGLQLRAEGDDGGRAVGWPVPRRPRPRTSLPRWPRPRCRARA
jgi:hypothetical protein